MCFLLTASKFLSNTYWLLHIVSSKAGVSLSNKQVQTFKTEEENHSKNTNRHLFLYTTNF
jgi:hypothetical protein